MKRFISHEPCPKCGSKDNLGVWEDGQKWCFGCGYYIPQENNLASAAKFVQPKDNNNDNLGVTLPTDFDYAIPQIAKEWLNKYELTNKELYDNHIGWSESKQLLITPCYIAGKLVFWQGRYFPQRERKCFTKGKPEDHTYVKGNLSLGSVVIVEDPISQIKVSRLLPTCCLFGSHINRNKIMSLSRMFNHIIWWLDNDKTKEMLTFQSSYKFIFDSSRIVFSDKDPKEYNTEEIKEFLHLKEL